MVGIEGKNGLEGWNRNNKDSICGTAGVTDGIRKGW